MIFAEEKKVTKADITPATDVVRYTYDSLGRVTSKSETGYNSYTVNLGYDAVGNINTIRSDDAAGGYNVSYTYNDWGDGGHSSL